MDLRRGRSAPRRLALRGRPTSLVLSVLFPQLFVASVEGQAPRVHRDLIYAVADGKELVLDLYLPDRAGQPLLVWVHGGAWRGGTKATVPPIFAEHGFATASLDFRQSTEARFPAQAHDIKAAIRFLRAKASEFGYDASRVAIGGNSSGGHLAALVGVTNGHAGLEGSLGEHDEQSSDVQAILVYYGASNLTTILSQSTAFGVGVREPALKLLLGGLPTEVPELAELASPVEHVTPDDPPLLILHGDQDPQMPINQAHELEGAYEHLGLDAELYVVHGAEHGGDVFYTATPQVERAIAFLRRTIGR